MHSTRKVHFSPCCPLRAFHVIQHGSRVHFYSGTPLHDQDVPLGLRQHRRSGQVRQHICSSGACGCQRRCRQSNRCALCHPGGYDLFFCQIATHIWLPRLWAKGKPRNMARPVLASSFFCGELFPEGAPRVPYVESTLPRKKMMCVDERQN